MAIPELTEEQRIESFTETRLDNFDNEIKFNKRQLAEFCLKEIDFVSEAIESTDIEDLEEASE